MDVDNEMEFTELRNNDNYLMNAFINTFMRSNYNNTLFPAELAIIIYNYYLQWKWDKNSNKDNRLNVSDDLMTVTSSITNYIDTITFATIFIGNWITQNGRYYFKFRFHGECMGSQDEIAIGIISKQYDIGNKLGIGCDEHGWSWYVWGGQVSTIYQKTFGKHLKYGLCDKDECIFEIIIKDDGLCGVNLYYQTFNDEPEHITFDTIMAPVKIGVSLNSSRFPLSLEIIEQQRPFQHKEL